MAEAAVACGWMAGCEIGAAGARGHTPSTGETLHLTNDDQRNVRQAATNELTARAQRNDDERHF